MTNPSEVVVTVPKLRDDRLCWLAVRDQLHRRARRNPVMFLAYVVGRHPRYIGTNAAGERLVSNAFGQGASQDIARGKMQRYAIAAYEVSARLNPDERQALRATGQVPTWFLPAVLDQAKTIRKGR